MKKIFLLFLIFSSLLCFSACGNNEVEIEFVNEEVSIEEIKQGFINNSNISNNTNNEEYTEEIEITFFNRTSGAWFSEDKQYFKLSDKNSFVYYDNYENPEVLFYGIGELKNGTEAIKELNLSEKDFKNINDLYSLKVELLGAKINGVEIDSEDLAEIHYIITFIEEGNDKIISLYNTNKNETTYFYKVFIED